MTADLVRQVPADEWDRRALECEAADIMARASYGGLHFGDLPRLDFLRALGVEIPPATIEDVERPPWLWKILGHDPVWKPPATA